LIDAAKGATIPMIDRERTLLIMLISYLRPTSTTRKQELQTFSNSEKTVPQPGFILRNKVAGGFSKRARMIPLANA
jgi:hypothetical protein